MTDQKREGLPKIQERWKMTDKKQEDGFITHLKSISSYERFIEWLESLNIDNAIKENMKNCYIRGKFDERVQHEKELKIKKNLLKRQFIKGGKYSTQTIRYLVERVFGGEKK